MSSINIIASRVLDILILIGIINFINVMITGVFTRQNELAVMESVSMMKKHIKKMMMFETLYYGNITTGLIFTVGGALIYWLASNV
ncbi:MAG: ABC transporter permease, partial [Ruminococcus sp.]|nr:ABC transporter permease [Ruminococcus sp.]